MYKRQQLPCEVVNIKTYGFWYWPFTCEEHVSSTQFSIHTFFNQWGHLKLYMGTVQLYTIKITFSFLVFQYLIEYHQLLMVLKILTHQIITFDYKMLTEKIKMLMKQD